MLFPCSLSRKDPGIPSCGLLSAKCLRDAFLLPMSSREKMTQLEVLSRMVEKWTELEAELVRVTDQEGKSTGRW